MKRLLPLQAILVLYSMSPVYAADHKITGEQALASSKSTQLPSAPNYNKSSPYATLPENNGNNTKAGAGKVSNGSNIRVTSGTNGRVSWSVHGDYVATYGVCKVRLIASTPKGAVYSHYSYATENDGGRRRNSANPSVGGILSGLSANTNYNIRVSYQASAHAWGCRGTANTITFNWTGT